MLLQTDLEVTAGLCSLSHDDHISLLESVSERVSAGLFMCQKSPPYLPFSAFLFLFQDNMDLGEEEEEDEKVCTPVLVLYCLSIFFY